jgi:hypothetical protein
VLCCELPEPERICPGCLAGADGHVAVIPATCSTHLGEVISLVVRDLGDGRITLTSETDGGYVLTVHAALLVDTLGEWLG